MARVLAAGLALTTVGCSVLGRPTAEPSAGSPVAATVPAVASGAAAAGSTLPLDPSALPSPSPAATVIVPDTTDVAPNSAAPSPVVSAEPVVSAAPAQTAAAEPSDNPHVDLELEAMLSRALGGATGTTVSRTGANTWCCQGYGIASLPGPPQAFADALGASIDDLTVAEAAPSGMGQAVYVRALRVRGADTSKLVDAWLALLDAEIHGVFTEPPNYERVVTHRTIGGKAITVVEDMNFGFIWDCLDYLYPHGDVLFVVTDTSHSSFTQVDWPTTEPTAGEVAVIAALP